MPKNIECQALKNQFEALSELPDEQVQFLIDRAEIIAYPQDSYLFKSDEPADYMTFILEGNFKISIQQNGNTNFIAELNPGDITGLLPFSRMEKARANAITTEDGLALQFPRSAMRDLIKENYELTESLVHEMTGRVRNFTTLQQQNERMISLGKLSAGLAHELNNPTAAIGRSAKLLEDHRRESLDKLKAFISLPKAQNYLDIIASLSDRIIESPSRNLGILEQQEAEDDWIDFFEDNAYENADNLVEQLLPKEIDSEIFEEAFEEIEVADRKMVLEFLSNSLNKAALHENISTAAERISDLVGSIKGFTHMDQAQDKGLADVHKGLESTLKILEYKLRKEGVAIVKDFQDMLRKIPLRVGQINQVFTNILDNAIDASKGVSAPQIKISTQQIRDSVYVKIEDNGPGIPEDLRALIFDPFFTTKGVGEGSGMGLEISRRIIEQHGGKLELESAQEPTIFSICLPTQA